MNLSHNPLEEISGLSALHQVQRIQHGGEVRQTALEGIGQWIVGFIAAAIGLIYGQNSSEIRQAMFRMPNASVTMLEREGQSSVWRVLEPPSDSYLSEEKRSWL